jgi:hypothetical protein
MNIFGAVLAVAVFASAVLGTEIWKEDRKVLACSPTKLGPSDTLVLTLGPKHGRELAITRHVDNIPFFLVVSSPPADMKSLMSPDEFAKARRVTFKTTDAGYAWVKDRGNERVFTMPGKYTVRVSEVLESERGGYSCTITYAP